MLEQRAGARTDDVHLTEQVSYGAVTGELERLPGVGGWFVVRLDEARSRRLRAGASRGFVPVTATVGGSAWDTSLMPMGDGTLFLALPATVRRAEDLDEGDRIRAVVRRRPRTAGSRLGRW